MLVNHWHVLPRGTFNKENPELGSLEHLTKIIDELGIDKAVLFAPFIYQIPEGWHCCNQWLHELIQGKQRFFGFITVDPLDANSIPILEEFAAKGFVGIKFHPPVVKARIDDPKIEPFYAKAEKLNLPIVFHTGVHGWRLNYYRPMLLDKVAQDHPQLKIIVEHMGEFEFFREALAVVRNNPNCYAGITGILHKGESAGWQASNELTRLLLKDRDWAVSPQRIIYGTDFPYNGFLEIKRDLEIIHSWNLPRADQEGILGENLEKLFPNR